MSEGGYLRGAKTGMRGAAGGRWVGFIIIAAGAALLSTGCVVPQPRGHGQLKRLVEPTTKRGYWQYLPDDYVRMDATARALRRWPVVVSFHGMKPFDNAVSQAREWEQEADRYGYIVVAPELHAPDVLREFPLREVTSALKSDEKATLAILDRVFATTNADPTNVLSTGWSSGGYMAHYIFNRHPERFSALGVRQCNFSAAVLDSQKAAESRNHPVFIANTENDFAICRRESKEAVRWYETHGYTRVSWVIIKGKGHERTPDVAAAFFSMVSGVKPQTPPAVLAKRQAIDGNPSGLRMLGRQAPVAAAQRVASRTPIRSAPPTRQATKNRRVPQAKPKRVVTQTPRRRVETQPPRAKAAGRTTRQPTKLAERRPRTTRDVYARSAQRQPDAMTVTPIRQTPTPQARSSYLGDSLSIRVSSAIGIEPLHLGFSAECPANWANTADFLWTINDQPVGSGIAGQKTITRAGVYKLGVLVVTRDGQEHRAQRTVRVLPRLRNDTIVGRGG